MRRWPWVVGVLLVVAAGCGGRPPAPPGGPVVLWRSGPVEPEFPLPPEASWAPTYQRLRCRLEERSGSGYRWTCFTGGGMDGVLGFYAARFGVPVRKVTVERRPGGAVLETVRSVAEKLGHHVPKAEGYGGIVRMARLGPAGVLPLVQLESPYLDLDTGALRRGTLISIRWSPGEDHP